MMTSAPASASASAIARPIPWAPPVTNATRPSSRNFSRYMATFLAEQRGGRHHRLLYRLVRSQQVDIAVLDIELRPGQRTVGGEIDPDLVDAIGHRLGRVLTGKAAGAARGLERFEHERQLDRM